jgi:biopolymer transport protein ExbD
VLPPAQFFVNGALTDPDRLEETLRPLLARSKERVVTFRGDEKIPYRWFVKVLDSARGAGAARVEVAHQYPP